MSRHPLYVLDCVAALRAMVKAEEQLALRSYWPIGDLPRPKRLTPQNRAPLDREWRRADDQGYERWLRATQALRDYDVVRATLRSLDKAAAERFVLGEAE